MNPYHHEEPEKPDVRQEKKIEYEDPIFETIEEEEEDNREYVETVSRHIAKLVQDENITNDAITCYLDQYFMQYVFRPHITVWIKWYKTKWITDQCHSANEAERQLYELSAKYDKYCQQRSYMTLLAKLRKEY